MLGTWHLTASCRPLPKATTFCWDHAHAVSLLLFSHIHTVAPSTWLCCSYSCILHLLSVFHTITYCLYSATTSSKEDIHCRHPDYVHPTCAQSNYPTSFRHLPSGRRYAKSCLCLTWYPLAPSQAFYSTFLSFSRIFIVLSLSLPLNQRIVGTYDISCRFVAERWYRNFRYDIHHNRSHPPIFFRLLPNSFSCSVFRLSLHSFCSNRTIHIQTGNHNPMPSGVWLDDLIPISRLFNLALPPWGREGHFFPSYYEVVWKKNISCRQVISNAADYGAWP